MQKIVSPKVAAAINQICFDYFSKNYPAIVKLVQNMKKRGLTIDEAKKTTINALGQTGADHIFADGLLGTVEHIYTEDIENQ